MVAPKAQGGLMPILQRNIDTNDMVVQARFTGFRRHTLLSWVPYLTGSKPQIRLNYHLKDKTAEVKNVRMECTGPQSDGLSSRIYAVDYGYSFEDKRQNVDHEPPLHQLLSTGEYQYFLSILFEYDDAKGGRSERLPYVLLLSSGHVPDRGNFYLYILSFLGGIIGAVIVQCLV